MLRVATKLRHLLWSRRTYALVYAVAVCVFQKQAGLSPEEAHQIVVVVVSWVISDSVKPTGGVNTTGPPLGVNELLQSMRFWALLASNAAVYLLPADISAPIVAALSTLIVGRALRSVSVTPKT